jgi:hypothetical protein
MGTPWVRGLAVRVKARSHTHKRIRLAASPVGLEGRRVDRLPDRLLGVRVVVLERHLRGCRDEEDAGAEVSGQIGNGRDARRASGVGRRCGRS